MHLPLATARCLAFWTRSASKGRRDSVGRLTAGEAYQAPAQSLVRREDRRKAKRLR